MPVTRPTPVPDTWSVEALVAELEAEGLAPAAHILLCTQSYLRLYPPEGIRLGTANPIHRSSSACRSRDTAWLQ